MPNQVKVFDAIEIRGGAKHGANLKFGGIQPEGVTFFTDFLEDTLSTDYFVATVPGTNDAIAINPAVGGHVRLTTGTVDDDTSMLALGLNWDGDKNAICEARIRINDVSQTAVFFGFSTSITTNQQMAFHYVGGAETSNASDAVGFCIDAEEATYLTSSILCVGVATNVDETAADSGTDWTDAAWHTLRVELTSAADNANSATNASAAFYLDGESVGYLDNAILSATDVGVVVHIGNRAGSAETVDVDYIYAYEDR